MSLLQAFDASEVEFLTAGTLEIDVDDWKKHTEYRNGKNLFMDFIFLHTCVCSGSSSL